MNSGCILTHCPEVTIIQTYPLYKDLEVKIVLKLFKMDFHRIILEKQSFKRH